MNAISRPFVSPGPVRTLLLTSACPFLRERSIRNETGRQTGYIRPLLVRCHTRQPVQPQARQRLVSPPRHFVRRAGLTRSTEGRRADCRKPPPQLVVRRVARELQPASGIFEATEANQEFGTVRGVKGQNRRILRVVLDKRHALRVSHFQYQVCQGKVLTEGLRRSFRGGGRFWNAECAPRRMTYPL